ncbi:MAG: DUF3106 domain-containing protein [Bacteriovoracaceae bacterium]|nr:DUF3106 domain-containing protein [Bacteriovoracaceae bacterium]
MMNKKSCFLFALFQILILNITWGQDEVKNPVKDDQNLAKWNELTNEQKDNLRAKYKAWQSMPEEKKTELKNRYERFKKLSPEKKEQFRKAFDRYKSLPVEKQQKLRERFQRLKKMDPKVRSERMQQLRERRRDRINRRNR